MDPTKNLIILIANYPHSLKYLAQTGSNEQIRGRYAMKVVATSHGWLWLSLGWALFKRSPLGWIGFVLGYWLLIALINEIPWVGAAVSTLLLPAFSVSFMAACAEAERGVRPSLRMMFDGFRHRLSTLIVVGGLYLMSILMVLGIASLVDGGTLFRWIVRGMPPPANAIADGSVLSALMLASVVAAPTFMAFWFAPVLTVWRNMGAAQSMFYSFFASLRNWRAFAMYGIVIAVAGLIFSLAITVMAVAFRGNTAVMRGLMLGLTIGLLPTIFASFYYSYQDIFGTEGEDTMQPPPGETIDRQANPPPPESDT